MEVGVGSSDIRSRVVFQTGHSADHSSHVVIDHGFRQISIEDSVPMARSHENHPWPGLVRSAAGDPIKDTTLGSKPTRNAATAEEGRDVASRTLA